MPPSTSLGCPGLVRAALTIAAAGALALSLGLPAPRACAGEDLRSRYGTDNLQAAQLLGQAHRLLIEERNKEAEPIIEEAIKADPNCPAAHYFKAELQIRLGRVDPGLESYKQCIALGDKAGVTNKFKVEAEVNLALILCRLKRLEEAAPWYTRAILEDNANEMGLRGKAWYNLGLSLLERRHGLAARAALRNAEADVPGTVPWQVAQEAAKAAEGQEAAHILHFPSEDKPPAARQAPGEPSEEPLGGALAATIAWLLPDPQGQYVLAVPRGEKSYFVIGTEAKLPVTAREAPGAIHAAALAEGSLFLACGAPPELCRTEPTTGKVHQRWPLQGTPTSLAVFPRLGVAFCVAEKRVRGLNLSSGKSFDTDLAAWAVAADTGGSFLYGYYKEDRNRESRWTLGGDGEPIFLWNQTLLWRAVVVGDKLVISDLRGNAATNGLQLGVSPDGRWVSAAGGGGWRPPGGAGGGGYGVAVFAGGDFEKQIGYYHTGAYPRGVSFNPVTGQLVAFTENDAYVFHITDPKSSVKLKGQFLGPAAWSGDGAWLFLARVGAGVTAYRNPLTAEEQAAAGNWVKSLSRPVFVARSGPTLAKFETLPGFAEFQVQRTDAAVRAALAAALRAVRTAKPAHWTGYAPYVKDPEVNSVVAAVRKDFTEPDGAGLAIYKLRKALEKDKASPPLNFYLAEGLSRSGQGEEAEPVLVQVVRADAGRSDLTPLALGSLAQLYKKKNDAGAALYCLALSLQADVADPAAREEVMPLLEKSPALAEEAKALRALATAGSGPGTGTPATASGLPELPKADPNAKALAAADLYGQAAESVVLITTAQGNGSGFCVGSGQHILTNAHVVGNSEEVTVVPFVVRKGRPVKLPEMRAKVLFKSRDADLAVLRLAAGSDPLDPLPVASETPAAGTKVFAIGSPGLGDKILEQSISEGIVSAPARKLDEQTYLQHTAAVNPGNSGGPLLNDKGHVVGLVTLKARLENVSFAIPVEVIRAEFKGK
ncbi:MAG TPA: trypsin-like peptidase domain-containing protein [Planctomycetota bacterium]|nr:trypsin-like peptidase domain-containing protein [Planctomycetota bacterium]